jgi:alkylation response protein AidB-like acyl-CoA dehydrogenase
MNFEFSDDSIAVREAVQRFLRDGCTPSLVRASLEGEQQEALDLWNRIATMGWIGVCGDESFGGSGLAPEAACAIAEQWGYYLTPAPFHSMAYAIADTLRLFATAEQKADWLSKLMTGKLIATIAFFGQAGELDAGAAGCEWVDGRLHGERKCVPLGELANVALVTTRTPGGPGVALCDLRDPRVRAETCSAIDPTRPLSHLRFEGVPAQLLGGQPPDGVIEHLADRCAAHIAFEQIGGAQACLDMACAYAKERQAFGHPIGAFQAIRHKLARVYVAIELARSNAYHAAWALDQSRHELACAAPVARVAASQAYELAARENIHVHGGIGVTWEADCHLHLRRAAGLASMLGSAGYWKRRIVANMATEPSEVR